MGSTIFDSVQAIIDQVLDVEEDRVTSGTSFVTDLKADEDDFTELWFEIAKFFETEFGIIFEVSEDDLLRTVQNLVDFVHSKLNMQIKNIEDELKKTLVEDDSTPEQPALLRVKLIGLQATADVFKVESQFGKIVEAEATLNKVKESGDPEGLKKASTDLANAKSGLRDSTITFIGIQGFGSDKYRNKSA